MKNLLIRLALYTCIALVPACGTRKMKEKISDIKQSEIQKESSKGQVVNSNDQKDSSYSNKTIADIKKATGFKVSEQFDTAGRLINRTYSNYNKESTKNTNSNKGSLKTLHTQTDSIFNNTLYKDRTITIHEKEKATDRSNNGWYWVVGIVGIAGLAFWFKPWIK